MTRESSRFELGAIIAWNDPRARQALENAGASLEEVPAGFAALIVSGDEIRGGDASTPQEAVRVLLALRNPRRALLVRYLLADPQAAIAELRACLEMPWRRFDA